MNQINLIRKTLRPHLSWHGARVTFLALFLVALVRFKTVNFIELAQEFMGTAKTESNEKRLYRFFREFDMDYRELARLGAGLMEISQPWVLSVDFTNWQFGDCTFNILMLGVIHEGMAFPLVWTTLEKKAKSIFRVGLDYLRRIFLNINSFEIQSLESIYFCPVLRLYSH
jgi:hypothetical protein